MNDNVFLQIHADRLEERLSKSEKTIAELCELLAESGMQIEYLHGKFQETGSGNSVLAKIKAMLAKVQEVVK